MGGARVRTRAVRGPLAPWAAGFESWLAARGYASRSVYHRACQLSLLSCWLEREGLTAGDLTDERAERFLAARRAGGRRKGVAARCLAVPLEYLREVGAVPELMPTVVREGGIRTCENMPEFSESRVELRGRSRRLGLAVLGVPRARELFLSRGGPV